MKYCQTTTENHPLALAHPQFVEDINAIAMAEGHTPPPVVFSNTETAINLDKAKRPVFIAEGVDLPKSMDMTVGLKSDDALQKEMLLVDFKLNVDNPNRIKEIDLKGKVDGSILLLGSSIPIHGFNVFIFKNNIVEQAKNRLARRFCTLPATYIAMDLHTLKATYF